MDVSFFSFFFLYPTFDVKLFEEQNKRMTEWFVSGAQTGNIIRNDILIELKLNFQDFLDCCLVPQECTPVRIQILESVSLFMLFLVLLIPLLWGSNTWRFTGDLRKIINILEGSGGSRVNNWWGSFSFMVLGTSFLPQH